MRINNKTLIFVVEDDKGLNALTTKFLKNKGFKRIMSFYDGESALEKLHLKPEVFIEDFDLPGMNGLQVMLSAKETLPEVEFIFMSGQGSIQVAVDTINKGAFDYVVKDSYSNDNLYNRLYKLLKIKALERERKYTRIAIMIFFSLLALCGIIYSIIHFTS